MLSLQRSDRIGKCHFREKANLRTPERKTGARLLRRWLQDSCLVRQLNLIIVSSNWSDTVRVHTNRSVMRLQHQQCHRLLLICIVVLCGIETSHKHTVLFTFWSLLPLPLAHIIAASGFSLFTVHFSHYFSARGKIIDERVICCHSLIFSH